MLDGTVISFHPIVIFIFLVNLDENSNGISFRKYLYFHILFSILIIKMYTIFNLFFIFKFLLKGNRNSNILLFYKILKFILIYCYTKLIRTYSNIFYGEYSEQLIDDPFNRIKNNCIVKKISRKNAFICFCLFIYIYYLNVKFKTSKLCKSCKTKMNQNVE